MCRRFDSVPSHFSLIIREFLVYTDTDLSAFIAGPLEPTFVTGGAKIGKKGPDYLFSANHDSYWRVSLCMDSTDRGHLTPTRSEWRGGGSEPQFGNAKQCQDSLLRSIYFVEKTLVGSPALL